MVYLHETVKFVKKDKIWDNKESFKAHLAIKHDWNEICRAGHPLKKHL